MKGNTLPELLLTILLAGIVLLFAFDGVDMLRTALHQSVENHSAEELLRLHRHEMMVELSDSVTVSDSIRYYRDGNVIATAEIW